MLILGHLLTEWVADGGCERRENHAQNIVVFYAILGHKTEYV